jgi:hypothetical protein
MFIINHEDLEIKIMMIQSVGANAFPNVHASEIMRQMSVRDSKTENGIDDLDKVAKEKKAQEKAAEQKAEKEKQAELEALKARDKEVRDHEMAHQMAAGQYFLSKSFEFTTGPDGAQYAISGKVRIDIAPEAEPEKTIEKMDQVRAAALAPSDPSPQDRKIAAEASQIQAAARQEMIKENLEQATIAQNQAISNTGQSASLAYRQEIIPGLYVDTYQ